MKKEINKVPYHFLQGGGACGALIRNINWTDTSIGAPDKWPIELKSAVRLMLDAPIGMSLFIGDEFIYLYNDAFIPTLGKTRHPLAMGKPAKDTAQVWSFIEPLFLKAMDGETVYIKDAKLNLDKNGYTEECFMDVSYMPIYRGDGDIIGIQSVLIETTDKVRAIQNIQKSEFKFRSLIEEAPVGTCVFTGREMVVEIVNDIMIGYWGKGKGVLGMPLSEALPELKGQPFFQLLDDVYTTGITFEAKGALVELEVDGVFGKYYFDFTYKAIRDASGEIYGVMNTSIDATARVLAQKKLEKSQQQLITYFEQSPVAIAIISKENLTFRMVNAFYGELVGRKPEEIENKTLLEALPELAGQGFDQLLKGVVETGIPYIANEVSVELLRNNQLETRYVNLTYQPQIDDESIITGILVVAIDVTLQVLVRQKIEEAEQSLRGAIELANLGTWTIDLKTRVLEYDQKLRNWFGFTTDEIITVEKAYAPITERHRPRIKAAIEHAVTPGTDNLYDVEYEIKELKNGLERIVHARGVAFFDDKGIAYKISGTAQDVTKERQIELELTKLVQHRTEELAASNEELQATNEEIAQTNEELEEANQNLYRSNEELSQYAYVASHDLQEPLRKILVFSGILSKQTSLSEENKPLIDKIKQSSLRMSLLINDLLEFSKLIKSEKMFRPVDLNQTVKNVVTDFELVISEKNATISIQHLPTIEAVSLQMNQLFYNIISNALKFIDANKTPVISIASKILSSEEAEKIIHKPKSEVTYYDIFISDNGIGFDVKYADQIFEVFKRLHGREVYPGSGIGLALCRRIVNNHGGYLFAESEVGIGTTFHIVLPDYNN